MITDEMIKTEFIHTIVTRDINRIYKTQERVVRANFQKGTGELANFLSTRPIEMTGSELKPVYHMRFFTYLRFLDIQYNSKAMKKHRRNLALYNRVIWGVIYHETLNDLSYGFSNQIRDLIREELVQFGGNVNTEIRKSWINSLF